MITDKNATRFCEVLLEDWNIILEENEDQQSLKHYTEEFKRFFHEGVNDDNLKEYSCFLIDMKENFSEDAYAMTRDIIQLDENTTGGIDMACTDCCFGDQDEVSTTVPKDPLTVGKKKKKKKSI